jgi:hypothetical protein
VAGPLRGLTLPCASRLTLLVDADPESARPSAAAWALRLLAGIERPTSGKVLALGGDPAEQPALRRAIALLGDDVLVDRTTDLAEVGAELARARGLDALASEDQVTRWLDANAADASPEVRRRRLSDALAAPERARLVLASHPERAADPRDRDAMLAQVRAAVRRGAHAVVATSRLDDVLGVAEGDALGAILHGGALLVAGPAHGLPWALPSHGIATRLVRVALREDEPRDDGPSPAARLAAELFGDATVAPHLVAVEPIGRLELRLHVRDPRAVGRALAARAKAGLAITKLVLHGASAEEIAAAYGYARAQGARW